MTCTTRGTTSQSFAPAAGDTYYLVVPAGTDLEGSYGTDSAQGWSAPRGREPACPRPSVLK